MSEELAKDIHNVIAQGEGPNVEFKSSFRWVYHQGKANKAPDLSILKTIAGFMNFEGGGTLLLGIDDDLNILDWKKTRALLKAKSR
ncbi:MAG: ATP-binding protein [Lentisphaerales bacterium]|nr:ATP-binding protein [Lentisphaerales bacterium]